MLEFLYVDAINLKDSWSKPDVVSELLQVAKKYEIPRLASICEQRAIRLLSVDTVIDFFILADRLGADQLKREASACITRFRSEVQATTSWQSLLRNEKAIGKIMPQLLECMVPPFKRLRAD